MGYVAWPMTGSNHIWRTGSRQLDCLVALYNPVNSVKFGVPQGSILGPTLFIIYINDIVYSTKNLQFISYADDTTLLCNMPSGADPSVVINNELKEVQKWLAANKLHLNVKKTQAIVFSTPRSTNHQMLHLTVGNEPITVADSINFLGINFDKNLNFHSHISKLRAKISRAVGQINKHKRILNTCTKKQLYYSLVHSHLSYGVELWGSAPQVSLKPLNLLQKKAIRAISNKKRNASTSPLFKNLKIAKLSNIYKISIAKLMFKAYHNKLPDNIQKHYSTPQQRATRQSVCDLSVRRRSTKIQNARPSISGPYIWNALPAGIRSTRNVKSFGTKVKISLIAD